MSNPVPSLLILLLLPALLVPIPAVSSALIFNLFRKPQNAVSSDQRLRQLATVTVDDQRHFNETLKQILVPRVPDTPSHNNVKTFIENYLRGLDWTVELDRFEDETPVGRKTFTNIIGTLNPAACQRVVLACHYESKYFADFDFLGATDSAVPCTMILELIRKLHHPLQQHKNSNNDVTLQVIFFDGEEAFHHWTSTDSLYGSRHLASKLNALSFRSGVCARSDIETELDRIQVLILLDLIGESGPRFCSYYRSTKPLFDRLERIERNLNRAAMMETKRFAGTQYFARCGAFRSSSPIDDDHIPFQKLGVNILHLISTPFPRNWHQEGDNGGNLHHPTINNLMKIFQVFITEHLNLSN